MWEDVLLSVLVSEDDEDDEDEEEPPLYAMGELDGPAMGRFAASEEKVLDPAGMEKGLKVGVLPLVGDPLALALDAALLP